MDEDGLVEVHKRGREGGEALWVPFLEYILVLAWSFGYWLCELGMKRRHFL